MTSYLLLVCCFLTHLESTVQKPVAIEPYAQDFEPSLEPDDLQAVAYEEILADVMKAILPKVLKSRKGIDINSWLRKVTNKALFQALNQDQQENSRCDPLRTTVCRLQSAQYPGRNSRESSTNVPDRPFDVENNSLDSMFQKKASYLNITRAFADEQDPNTSLFGGTSGNKASISRNGRLTDVTEVLVKNKEENYVSSASNLYETLTSLTQFQKSVSTVVENTVTSSGKEESPSIATTSTTLPPSVYGVNKPIIYNGATEMNDKLIAVTSNSPQTTSTTYSFTSKEQFGSGRSQNVPSIFSHYSISTPPDSESKESSISALQLPHSDIDVSTILSDLSDISISSGSTGQIENLPASAAVTGTGMPTAVTSDTYHVHSLSSQAEIYATSTSAGNYEVYPSAVTTNTRTSSATTPQNYHSLSHSLDENLNSITSVSDSTVSSNTDDDTVNILKETLSSRSPVDPIDMLPHNEKATTTEGVLQRVESLELPAESSNKSFHPKREEFTGKSFSEKSKNLLSVKNIVESVIKPSLSLDGTPASDSLNLASYFKGDLVDILSNIIHDSVLKSVHKRSNYDRNSPLIHNNSKGSTLIPESIYTMNNLSSVPKQNYSTVTKFEPSHSFSRILYVLSKYISDYIDKHPSSSATDRFRSTHLSTLQHDRNSLRNSLVEQIMSSLANTSFSISSKSPDNFKNLLDSRDIRQDSELRGDSDLESLSLRGFSSLKDLADDIIGCFLNTLSRHIHISKSFMQNYFKSNIPAVTEISKRCTQYPTDLFHTTPSPEERDKSPDPSFSVSVGTEVLPCSSTSHGPPTFELGDTFNTLVKELSNKLHENVSATTESSQSAIYTSSNSGITPQVTIRDDMKSNFEKVTSYLISGLLNDVRELENVLNDSRKFSHSLFQRVTNFLSMDPYVSSMIQSLADAIAYHFAKGPAESHGQSHTPTSNVTPKVRETERLNNSHSKSPFTEVMSSDFTAYAKLRTNNSEYLSSTEYPLSEIDISEMNYSPETSHYPELSNENDCDELGDGTESVERRTSLENNSHSYYKTIFMDYTSSTELISTISEYSYSTESTVSNTEVLKSSSYIEFFNESNTDVSTEHTEYIDTSEEETSLECNEYDSQPGRQTQSKEILTERITTSEIITSSDSVYLPSVESCESESEVSKALNTVSDSLSSFESFDETDSDSDEVNATESTVVTEGASDISHSNSTNSTAITSKSSLLSNRCDTNTSTGTCRELVGISDESNSNPDIEQETELEFRNRNGSKSEDRNRVFEIANGNVRIQFKHSSPGSLHNKSELNFVYKSDKGEESPSKGRVNVHKSEGSFSDGRILPFPKPLSSSKQERSKELINGPLLKYYFTRYGYPYPK